MSRGYLHSQPSSIEEEGSSSFSDTENLPYEPFAPHGGDVEKRLGHRRKTHDVKSKLKVGRDRHEGKSSRGRVSKMENESQFSMGEKSQSPTHYSTSKGAKTFNFTV